MIKPNHPRQPLAHSKIKVSNYINIGILLSLFFYPLWHLYAAISCSVTTQAACTGGSVTLLRMSGSTNAQVELPSQSNSNYDNNVVCCSSSSSIGNSCSASNKQIFAKISAVTNAHVQETTVNTYPQNVCLSDSVGNDTITVGYQNSNCTGYDTTIASISASDNAHAGDSSAYTRKICATVIPQTISFDLDTASDFHNGESSAPYSVPLGTLISTSVTHSDDTAIRMIVVEGDTNAVGGMVVTVQNTNGTNGLVSASVPGDDINSSTNSMVVGTENYGLCVATVGLTGFSRATGYSLDSCALSSGTNGVRALSTTPTDILNSAGAPLSGGHAEVVVNAENSVTTAAHNDYADTLTFIATGTF